MRTVLLASLRVHTRRYVAAVLAVTLAVAFVVATDALASSARAGLTAGVSAPYASADLVVGESYGIEADEAERAVAAAEEQGASTAMIGSAFEALVADDGRQLDGETSIGTVSLDPDHRWQEVVSGRAPETVDEAILDENAARSRAVQVGDRVTIGTGSNTVDVEVVGLSAPVAYLSATVYVPWETLRVLPSVYPDSVLVTAGAGGLGTVQRAVEEAVTAPVVPRETFVVQRQAEVSQGVDVVSYLVLVFAAVAAFVAVLVVANTFTILFAQRSRDMALLRAVGAGRRQLRRSIRLEALVIGVLASALGLLVGALIGIGVVALAQALAGSERMGAISWSPTWWAAAFIGGVATTMVAAWWPTRAVTRVSPLAALRPEAATDVRSRIGLVRVALGLVLASVGVAFLAMGISTTTAQLTIAGCFTSFVGILVLGPVVVPAVIRLLGLVIGRTGAPSRLAVDNAVRHPRRTAATTASLLVGVTLTSAVLTVMASGRGAIEAEQDVQYPVDLVLSTTSEVPDGLVDRVAATPGVEAASLVPGATVTATAETPGDLGEVSMIAPDAAAVAATRDGGVATDIAAGQVLLTSPYINALGGLVPETLTVAGPAGTVELDVVTSSADVGETLVVAPETLEQLVDTPRPQAIWALAEDGADPDDLGGDLGLIGREGGMELANQLERREWVTLQLDVVVGAVVGLLGIAVLIALAGIGNTLGLSVLERGRENALVRALGLTRGQLRRSLGVEGLLLALTATVMGVLLGVVYGWTGVRTIVEVATPDAQLVVPVGQLAAVAAVATAAGVIACVLPARRAGRVPPAAGLVVD